jgi:hypothetical protein
MNASFAALLTVSPPAIMVLKQPFIIECEQSGSALSIRAGPGGGRRAGIHGQIETYVHISGRGRAVGKRCVGGRGSTQDADERYRQAVARHTVPRHVDLGRDPDNRKEQKNARPAVNRQRASAVSRGGMQSGRRKMDVPEQHGMNERE